LEDWRLLLGSRYTKWKGCYHGLGTGTLKFFFGFLSGSSRLNMYTNVNLDMRECYISASQVKYIISGFQ
jgi:hypothetical protein